MNGVVVVDRTDNNNSQNNFAIAVAHKRPNNFASKVTNNFADYFVYNANICRVDGNCSCGCDCGCGCDMSTNTSKSSIVLLVDVDHEMIENFVEDDCGIVFDNNCSSTAVQKNN